MKKFISVFFILALFFSSLPGCLKINAEGFTQATNSNAIYLVNTDTGRVLYEKQADIKVEPASTTKIMTYIVAVENCQDLNNTMVTVTEEITRKLQGTESSLSNVKNGETLSMYELLNCLMIPSGNDAAMVIADFIGKEGSVDAFVQKMNDKAQELGCENTHFMNPHGLHDSEHYTTAKDMYKMTSYALTLPKFIEIVSQVKHTIPQTNLQPQRNLITTNKMMLQLESKYYSKYVKGIKTGWHDEAGHCIVSSASKDNCNYVCVAMGAFDTPNNDNGAMLDAKHLYDWAFENYSLHKISASSSSIAEVKLKLAWNRDKLVLIPEKDMYLLLPKSASTKDISYGNIQTSNVLFAPINKGDILGTATVYCGGEEVSKINLTSSETIPRNILLYIIYIIKSLLTSVWFWLAVIAIFIFTKIIKIKLKTKRRKMRHVRDYKNRY